MKCVIIGICQLEAVSKILQALPAFRARFPQTEVYLVFSLTAEEMGRILREKVPQADLVISQPVSRSYRGDPIFSTGVLRQSLKEGARHLVVSNCYFTGYDPAPFQTTSLNGEILHRQRLSYYPALAMENLLRQEPAAAARAWCDPDAYSAAEVEANAQASLRALREREEKVFEEDFGVDVRISDFVEREWRRQHLFHTYNHPSNSLLLELARRVAAAAGVPWSQVEGNGDMLSTQLLGDNIIPPPPSVYLAAGFTFLCPRFVLAGRAETTREAMEKMAAALQGAESALQQRWLGDVKMKLAKK